MQATGQRKRKVDEEGIEGDVEESNPVSSSRRRLDTEEEQRMQDTTDREALSSALTSVSFDDDAAAAVASESLGQCQICLESMASADADTPSESDGAFVVRLTCGHAYHGLSCLGNHMQSACADAEQRVSDSLQQHSEGISQDDRRAAFGGDSDLAVMRARGAIRQCPRCGYGPVLNTNCSDLRTHDATRGNGTGRTTNQCPSCSFFSATWTNWATWDPEDVPAAARCPLCRGSCQLIEQDIAIVKARIHSVEEQLDELYSRQANMSRLSVDFFTLLGFLQDEVEGVVGEAEDTLDRILQDRLAFQAIFSCALTDVMQRRVDLEDRIARRCLAESWSQSHGSAESRRGHVRRLVTEFETLDGFDGASCAEAVASMIPGVSDTALEAIRSARIMSEPEMDDQLVRLQEQAKRRRAARANPDKDIFVAINTIQELIPRASKFEEAVKRCDFMLAMHTGEGVKAELEAVVLPVASKNPTVAAALRPLRWSDSRFAELPGLQAVAAVLRAQLSSRFSPSTLANIAGGAPRSADDDAEDDEHEHMDCVEEDADQLSETRTRLRKDILAAVRQGQMELTRFPAIVPGPGQLSAVASSLEQRINDLMERRRQLALLLCPSKEALLSIKRGRHDPLYAGLARPWQPVQRPRQSMLFPASAPRGYVQPDGRRALRLFLVRHARLRRTPVAELRWAMTERHALQLRLENRLAPAPTVEDELERMAAAAAVATPGYEELPFAMLAAVVEAERERVNILDPRLAEVREERQGWRGTWGAWTAVPPMLPVGLRPSREGDEAGARAANVAARAAMAENGFEALQVFRRRGGRQRNVEGTNLNLPVGTSSHQEVSELGSTTNNATTSDSSGGRQRIVDEFGKVLFHKHIASLMRRVLTGVSALNSEP